MGSKSMSIHISIIMLVSISTSFNFITLHQLKQLAREMPESFCFAFQSGIATQIEKIQTVFSS